MSDLEMTKLCAEAMGFPVDEQTTATISYRDKGHIWIGQSIPGYAYERFELAVWGHAQAGEWKFHAECNYTGGAEDTLGLGHGDTHNRAIVECVAMMQASKTPAPPLP